MHRPWKLKVAIGLIAALVVLCLMGLAMSGKSNDTTGAYRGSELRVLPPNDVAAQTDWARRWCRGWNVPDLAAVFDVEPTKEAIAAYLSKGLQGKARRAVIKTCERELEKADKTQGRPPAS